MQIEAVVDKVRALLEDNSLSQACIEAYWTLAGEHILRKRYPYHSEPVEVPQKYRGLQLEICLYLLNKRGAEGELSHSELGVSRSYESASVPSSMLASVKPYCKGL